MTGAANGRTSRTVQVGDRLTMSDRPLGTVTAVARWQSRPELDGWSAHLTFDDGRTLTLAPGTYLPFTVDDTTPALPCGGRPGDFLHHDDGSHRGTPSSTNGRVLERFEREARAHRYARA